MDKLKLYFIDGSTSTVEEKTVIEWIKFNENVDIKSKLLFPKTATVTSEPSLSNSHGILIPFLELLQSYDFFKINNITYKSSSVIKLEEY